MIPTCAALRRWSIFPIRLAMAVVLTLLPALPVLGAGMEKMISREQKEMNGSDTPNTRWKTSWRFASPAAAGR